MDQEQNQMQSAPQLCQNGCGYYGSPSFDGLCSKCHKDAVKKDSPQSAAQNAADLSYVLQDTSALLHSASKQGLSVFAQKADSSSASQSQLEEPAPSPSSSALSQTLPSPSAAPAQPSTLASSPATPSASPSTAAAASSAAAADADDDEPPKKKKNRCDVCRKKVGLTGFTCRCDGLFCSIHRYSDKHECHFDYRQLGQQEIRKNNPVVVGEKVNKI